ncbi:uncharacterized protein LOC107041914 [Diachasma alloeum]|uniref:uncharacterized protein LOC107041914 n=1 Tax=Diachasma alloeum TaxID=454923 RepID=UPI0007381428|nr:uncharacterized protein LOC107041914 [Diachasma alloeum]
MMVKLFSSSQQAETFKLADDLLSLESVKSEVQAPILTHPMNNLTKHQLSETQVSVLAKGHNFAVAPKKIPTEEIISQTETAIYHLPQETGDAIRRKLSNILHKVNPPSDNITEEERLALRTLKENNDIIILPADKGNAIVVIDRDDYSGKLSAMLGDSRVYTKLRKDPLAQLNAKPPNS